MKPKLYCLQEMPHWSEAQLVVESIRDIECTDFFSNHIGLNQPEQKQIVADFQGHLFSKLRERVPRIEWHKEYKAHTSNRDSIDIFGSLDGLNIVVELDKPRADQVAKKFVSRSATLSEGAVFYIALCYPGTAAMRAGECKKYFGYCRDISMRLNNGFAGFLIE